MKKKECRIIRFRDFVPFLILVVFYGIAIAYCSIKDLTNEDFIKRTMDFWIDVTMIFLGSAVVYIQFLADSIKKRDYLKLTFQLIQGIVVISAAVYGYFLQVDMVSISQSRDTYLQSDNFDMVHKLMEEQLSLLDVESNLSIATIIIVFSLAGLPDLIRKLQNWITTKKRGEDH